MTKPVFFAELRATGKGNFSLSGELTFISVPNLWRKSEHPAANTNGKVVLDLGEVTHSDSAGLALMVAWLRQSRDQNATIMFRNIPQQMLSLARTAGVDFLLEAPD
uniref:Phospholipid transport system transporter-binding protein n=1 Tax=Candidatus Kentrum sp. FW TaxID=2126338 RepID=A0A450U2D4_9GAMM|nr:MAG: phospholipid transport system transporter-binding protein [Candidatus Kentron sp. FW]